jgi:hypothetical protein
MADFLDFFLHAEKHLAWFTQNYGHWIYLLLFLISSVSQSVHPVLLALVS